IALSFLSSLQRHQLSPLFPYTTLFRSHYNLHTEGLCRPCHRPAYVAVTVYTHRLAVYFAHTPRQVTERFALYPVACGNRGGIFRSEEHTSELQSRFDLVCRLLLEKKNK